MCDVKKIEIKPMVTASETSIYWIEIKLNFNIECLRITSQRRRGKQTNSICTDKSERYKTFAELSLLVTYEHQCDWDGCFNSDFRLALIWPCKTPRRLWMQYSRSSGFDISCCQKNRFDRWELLRSSQTNKLMIECVKRECNVLCTLWQLHSRMQRCK